MGISGDGSLGFMTRDTRTGQCGVEDVEIDDFAAGGVELFGRAVITTPSPSERPSRSLDSEAARVVMAQDGCCGPPI